MHHQEKLYRVSDLLASLIVDSCLNIISFAIQYTSVLYCIYFFRFLSYNKSMSHRWKAYEMIRALLKRKTMNVSRQSISRQYGITYSVLAKYEKKSNFKKKKILFTQYTCDSFVVSSRWLHFFKLQPVTSEHSLP